MHLHPRRFLLSIDMKENMWTVRNTEEVVCISLTGVCMKGSGVMVRKVVLERTHTATEMFTKEIGRMIRNTVKVFTRICRRLEPSLKVKIFNLFNCPYQQHKVFFLITYSVKHATQKFPVTK